MGASARILRYEVGNDGIGPYAIFYCDSCGREFRSTPDVANTITKDIGRQAMGGFLRNIPMVGGAIAQNVTGDDPRYSHNMTQQQLDKAWSQVKDRFRECPTCAKIVCLSDFDERSGYCNQDSPRKNEIAEAQGEQVGEVFKGLASAFGLDGAIKQAGEAAKRAATGAARCPKDGTFAPAGTKFCPECGTPMVQPKVDACPKCGADTKGGKFCPECGTKIERVPVGVCPSCGAQTKGAKFCPECGTKLA